MSGERQPAKRIEWLDVLKCLAMFIVIVGHTYRGRTPDTLRYYIYTFHMPLFFMISGMGFQIQTSRHHFTAGQMVRNKVRTLLWPYFILNILVIPLWYYRCRILFRSKETFGTLILAIFYSNQKWNNLPASATWFIPCLFLSMMLFYAITRISTNDQQTAIFSILAGLVTYTMSVTYTDVFPYPWHLATVPMGCMFFMIGYMFMKYHDRIESALPKKLWQEALLVLGCLGLGYFCARNNVKISMGVNSYGSLVFFLLSSLPFSFVCYLVSRHIPGLGVFRLIGRNTIVYLAFHQQFILILSAMGGSAEYFLVHHPMVVSVSIFIGLIPLAWVIEKFAPFLIGKKKRTFRY